MGREDRPGEPAIPRRPSVAGCELRQSGTDRGGSGGARETAGITPPCDPHATSRKPSIFQGSGRPGTLSRRPSEGGFAGMKMGGDCAGLSDAGAATQVMGARPRQASEKRHGTKSRGWGRPRMPGQLYGEFGSSSDSCGVHLRRAGRSLCPCGTGLWRGREGAMAVEW